MEIKLVKRYFAECGREFKRKHSALHHEIVCKCWSNPRHKTCKTCRHSSTKEESDDVSSWKYNDCDLNIDEYSKEWNQPNIDVDVNINCIKWEML